MERPIRHWAGSHFPSRTVEVVVGGLPKLLPKIVGVVKASLNGGLSFYAGPEGPVTTAPPALTCGKVPALTINSATKG
jgi:hypothetical protein